MNHSLNYEKFLVSRPLFAKFEYARFGIPILWKTKFSLHDAKYIDILNIKNINNKIVILTKLLNVFHMIIILILYGETHFRK